MTLVLEEAVPSSSTEMTMKLCSLTHLGSLITSLCSWNRRTQQEAGNQSSKH